ncbi:phage tail tape measure C-terminal domain-containing protein [Luteolibacter marinus]|uniref:phage tail tape measure C-terminal domain-containing protein n=1 Tax=Luteolibacter marinus TaxID=2776705 RepID=UPI0018664E7D
MAGVAFAAVGVAGIAAVKGITDMVNKANAVTDSLAKQSDRLGIATESLQAYRNASELAGVSNSTLEKGLAKLNRNVGDIKNGLVSDTSAIVKAFDVLGVSIDEIKGQSPEKTFEAIVDQLGAIEDPATQAALATQLFGRSGQEMITLFKAGTPALEKAKQTLKDYGLEITRLDAKKAEDLNDAFTEANQLLTEAKQKLAIELSPVLTEIIQDFLEAGKAGGGIGPAIAEGVKIGVDSLRVLQQAVRAATGGQSVDTTTALENGGDAVLIEKRLSDLRAIQDRIASLQAQGKTITGGGDFDIARQFGGPAQAFTGIMDLDEAASRARTEVESLKAALAELPPVIVAQAAANRQLLEVEDQRRAGQISDADAAATSEAIRNGLKSQTEELEWQAKLGDELLEKEAELLEFNKRQVAEKAEIAALTKEIEEAGGSVLPPKEFEQVADSFEQLIPLSDDLADSIATGPESIAGSFDRAAGASGEFREAATTDLVAVTNHVEATMGSYEKLFLTLNEYGQSVTGNLESAIDEFTRSGKLNMAEFTRSVLADLAAIAAKAAILGGILGNESYGGNGSGLVGSLVSSIFSGSISTAGAPRAIDLGTFEGGGFTGYGTRSGGLDGKGGFPAILHPNETVIDHTRGQSLGGDTYNVNQTVVIRETMPAGQARAIIDAASKKSLGDFLNQRQRGGGRARAFG